MTIQALSAHLNRFHVIDSLALDGLSSLHENRQPIVGIDVQALRPLLL